MTIHFYYYPLCDRVSLAYIPDNGRNSQINPYLVEPFRTAEWVPRYPIDVVHIVSSTRRFSKSYLHGDSKEFNRVGI